MSTISKYCYNPAEKERAFYLHHVCLRSTEQIGLHEQKTWELSYIIRGSGMRIVGKMMQAFQSGEVILIPPEIPHHWIFDGNDEIENITLTFYSETLWELKNTFPELAVNIVALLASREAIFVKGENLQSLQMILLRMTKERESRQVASFVEIIDVLATTKDYRIIGVNSVNNIANERMQKLHMYIMCNYQQSISLSDIAKYLYMEKTAFCSFFRKCCTFVEFLLDYRIEIVCQLLKTTDRSISDICHSSGFQDVPYFNRVFKRLKGVSPNQYRKNEL